MTVREYLDFVARIKGVPPAERNSARRRAMERTRIADMANRALRQAVEGLPPARRPRAGAPAQPGRAHPRRADRRPRPEADHRDARAHSKPRRRPHDHPEHAHPSRGRADLPARRHHQQGARGRGRHARQPDGASAGDRKRSTCRWTRRARTRVDAARRVPGVTRVASAPISTRTPARYEVESERGRDVRRDLARGDRRRAAGACSSCGRCA